MKRTILKTSDGSTTIYLPDWNESYHSKHGAIQEAKHVFIKNGLEALQTDKIAVLEIGFGTGLNAFITFLEATNKQKQVEYTGIEAYPIASSEIASLNYIEELDAKEHQSIFEKMHFCPWFEKIQLRANFLFEKRKQFFQEIVDRDSYDLIYFDAFGYRVQPELWSTLIFKKMYDALKPKGILVTYAARGVVKRSLIEVGFTVEKLAGPPGKREMFRATKESFI